MRVSLWVCALLCWITTGCTVAHTQQTSADLARQWGLADRAEVRRGGTWVLPAESHIYLAFPHSTETEPQYPRLLLSVADALQEQMGGRFTQLQSAPWLESKAQSWQHAAGNRYDFLVLPELIARSDQLSSLSEIRRDWRLVSASAQEAEKVGRDRLALRLQVYDVRSGRLLDTITVNVVSSRMAWTERTPNLLAAQAASALADPLMAY